MTAVSFAICRAPAWAALAIVTGGVLPSVASAATFPLPPDNIDVIGEVRYVRARYEDTLLDIGRVYGVGYQDIIDANPGVDPWLPGEDTRVVIPTRFILPDAPRRGVIVNLPEYRLYYFPEPAAGEDAVVITHPLSIGRMDWRTPLGVTHITAKAANPAWYPPQSVIAEARADGESLPRVVPPGPDNPLGKHALRLGIPGYLIHGTNRPAGVGMRVTHGCMRMYPEDIASLFEKIPLKTPVRIINRPYKLGWYADTLYLEAHAPLEEDEDLRSKGVTALTELVVAATPDRLTEIDWDVMEQYFTEALGIPMALSLPQLSGQTHTAMNDLDGWCSAGARTDLCRSMR